MKDTNLLQETIIALTQQSKTVSEVLWVGAEGVGKMSWDQFASVADFMYNSDFGLNEIRENLVVAGSDWWLERWEYDGSEGWSYKTLPKEPEAVLLVNRDTLSHEYGDPISEEHTAI